jgi:hypothetical protein
MFYHPKVYWKDRWVAGSGIVLLISQIFMWVYALKVTPNTEEHLFLHYNIIFSVDLAGEWWKIFFVPIGGVLILFANVGMSWFLYGEDKILARFLSVIGAFLNLCIAWALYLILSINV